VISSRRWIWFLGDSVWLDQGIKYRTQAWKWTTSNPSGLMPN